MHSAHSGPSHRLLLHSARPVVTFPAIGYHCPWPVPNYTASW